MNHNPILLSSLTITNSSFCHLVLKDSVGPPPEYGFPETLLVTGVLVLVLTVLGNAVTIVAVVTHRKLQTKTNAFIVSLAVADLCVALLVMPFAIYQQANNKVWTLGDTLCRLSASLDVMLCTVSIFHLSSIALDRYRAICQPLLPRKVREVKLMLVFCWVTPIFISFLPIMNGWNEVGIEDFMSCAFPPEAHACVFMVNIPFAVICSLIAFYIPLVFMGVCNVKIYLATSQHADRSRSRGASRSQTWSKEKTDMSWDKRFWYEIRVAKTLSIVMGCFSVCWFPFFIFNVIDPFIGYRIPYIPWVVALWLGYINSMMNPVIYFFFNRTFKYAIDRMLRCRVCMDVYNERKTNHR